MTSKRISDNSISIVKEWRRNLGWVAKAEYWKEGNYWKTKNTEFLPTQPISEEDKEKNYRKKSNEQLCIFPDTYSGLIISSSQFEGSRCERWYWMIENGKITNHAETLDELLENKEEE